MILVAFALFISFLVICCYFTNLLDKMLGWAIVEVDDENGLRRLSRSLYSRLSGLSRGSSKASHLGCTSNSVNDLGRENDAAMYEMRPVIKRSVSLLTLSRYLINHKRYGSQAGHWTLDSSTLPSRKTSAASHHGVYLGSYPSYLSNTRLSVSASRSGSRNPSIHSCTLQVDSSLSQAHLHKTQL